MILVSCNASGEPADSYNFHLGMCLDGRYGAFTSYASNMFAPDEVGEEQDVSVEFFSASDFLAERPMYFNYNAECSGGHSVVGCLPWSIVGWTR